MLYWMLRNSILRDTADPPSGPSPAPVPVVGQPPAAPQGLSRQELERELANTRAEAAAHRISARDAHDALTAKDQEITQLRNQNAQQVEAARTPLLERINRTNERLLDTELRAAALQEGLVDPDLLPLIDRAGVVVSDDGTVAGVKEAVTKFKTAKPNYFQPAAGTEALQPGGRRVIPPVHAAPSPAPANAGVGERTVKNLDDAAYSGEKNAMFRRLKNASHA